jgi:hypothetical protein
MKEQEQYIRDNIINIAEKSFPDNIGNEWIIHNIMEHPKGIEVEVEPKPDNVGYTRFRFIIEFKSPTEPNITFCYCLEDTGEWDLMFTG